MRREESYPLQALASLEAEGALLGSLLLDNEAFDRVGDLVSEGDFFDEVNRAVFVELQRQLLAGRAADVITVAEGLAATSVTIQDVHALTLGVASSANVRRYAELVRERALSRALLQVSGEISELAQDHSRSIADRVEAAQGQLGRLVGDAPRDEWVSAWEGMAQHSAVLEQRASGQDGAMSTGLPDLDNYLEGGLRPGELVIVGARPSMGKTALAMTMGVSMAADYCVGMLSMEMPHAELRDRMTAMLGRVSLSSVKRPAKGQGLDWDRVVEGIEKARSLNFYVSDQSGLNINQLRSKARNIKRLHGLHVLMVDYIGLMSGLDSRQPRAYQLEEISRGLKTLAKELGVAVVCLAQVNRKVEERTDHDPNLSDLRDSGAIEQDADVVIFVHRPIQSRPDLGPEWNHYARVKVAKNRQGRCGVLSLSYVGDQTRFAGWQGEPPTSRARFARAEAL
jgi:replicative DNA helicase